MPDYKVERGYQPYTCHPALSDDASRIVCITNGADAYMSKPFNMDVLGTTIRQLVKTRGVLKASFNAEKHAEKDVDRVEVESSDELLMKRIMKVINDNIDDSDLSVESIAEKIGLSRVHLYRRLKAMTGQTPREFIKYVRLKEAARLFSERDYDITSVSAATGFKSLSTFSAAFKSLYGMPPTEWMKRSRPE